MKKKNCINKHNLATMTAFFLLCLLLLTSCSENAPTIGTQVPTATTGMAATNPSEYSSPSGDVTVPIPQPSDPISSVPTEPSDVHQHEYDGIITPPTCTIEGYTVYRCTCGNQYTGSYTPATGHQYVTETMQPTCTEDGYTIHTCPCGDSYTGAQNNATGHSWGSWQTIVAPTETSTGTAKRTCSTCNAAENRQLDKIIPSHTHSYSAKVTKNPTCTDNGVKTYTCTCGGTYTESIAKLSHAYTSKVTSPTCTTQGYTTHTCNRCAYQYTDNNMPATGHRYALTATVAATCFSDGSNTYICNNCKDIYSETIAGSHQYQHATIAPTCVEAGYTKHTCAICSHSYTDNTVAATGHNWSSWNWVRKTCTEESYLYFYCVCGASEIKATRPATDHSFIIVGERGGNLIYNCVYCNVGYVDDTNSRYEATLSVPEIASIHATNTSISINCYASFKCNSGYGYQCLLARDANFTCEVENIKIDYQWNDWGYAKLAYYTASGSYYYKIRAYKMEGETFVYGPWSETGTIACLDYNTKLSKEAEYSYDIYFVDNFGTNVYTDTCKAIYVQTDNPSGDSIRLIANGRSIVGHVISMGRARYYEDAEYLDIADCDALLQKVPGGYLGIIRVETAGNLDVEVREASPNGYTVAKTFQLNVLDYETERNKWIDNTIAKIKNDTMNSKELMDAIAWFLDNGQFKYLTNIDGTYVSLAKQPNSPWFLSMRWDSCTSPAMLAVFAERIGGFDEIHNCFPDYPRGTSEWWEYHHQIYVVYKGVKFYYSVCPYTPTGDVGSIEMINFSDTSRMTLIG